MMLESKKCPDCNTKLRKFKDGYICQKNHKFLIGSNVYNDMLTEIANNQQYSKDIKSGLIFICPICQEEGGEMPKRPYGGIYCKNGHAWTSQYYAGDKRYVCENPPEGFSFDF